MDKLRSESPRTYEELVELVCQTLERAGIDVSKLPIGISVAGLLARETGHAITAILPTFGNFFQWILAKQQVFM